MGYSGCIADAEARALDLIVIYDEDRLTRSDRLRERLAVVHASLRQRDAAINDARTARRARVRAAADQAPLDPELRVTRR
jgi:hypothetical protein